MTSRLASFVRNLVRRDRVEHDLDEELRAFVEQTAEEKQNAGLSLRKRRRGAHRPRGMEQVKSAARRKVWIHGRSAPAGRVVRRADAPQESGFAAIAVTTLALGVGATTVFSVVDTVVFRRLPIRNPTGS